MDMETIPVIEDDHLEKFILQLCYRPNFSKRTIPGIQDDMDHDIQRMKNEIKAGGITHMRKMLLYRRIEGRKRMSDDMQKIFDQELELA